MNAPFDATSALGNDALNLAVPDHQIAVIGLGYIGLPTAALLAARSARQAVERDTRIQRVVSAAAKADRDRLVVTRRETKSPWLPTVDKMAAASAVSPRFFCFPIYSSSGPPNQYSRGGQSSTTYQRSDAAAFACRESIPTAAAISIIPISMRAARRRVRSAVAPACGCSRSTG
jgi:hypothetical protein